MGWTSITSTRYDADSPIDEDLMGDIVGNGNFLFDSAIRCGTFAVPVRLAEARERHSGGGTESSGFRVTVTVSPTYGVGASADDGNANFASAPRVVFSLEEDTSSGSGQDWDTDDITITRAYIPDGTISTTGFSCTIVFDGVTSSADVDFYLHWIAIGPVTPGE